MQPQKLALLTTSKNNSNKHKHTVFQQQLQVLIHTANLAPHASTFTRWHYLSSVGYFSLQIWILANFRPNYNVNTSEPSPIYSNLRTIAHPFRPQNHRPSILTSEPSPIYSDLRTIAHLF